MMMMWCDLPCLLHLAVLHLQKYILINARGSVQTVDSTGRRLGWLHSQRDNWTPAFHVNIYFSAKSVAVGKVQLQTKGQLTYAACSCGTNVFSQNNYNLGEFDFYCLRESNVSTCRLYVWQTLKIPDDFNPLCTDTGHLKEIIVSL